MNRIAQIRQRRMAAKAQPESGRHVIACESVTIGMASIPGRRKNLPGIVAALLPQVDRLCVYLNGYSDVPACLDHPKVSVFRSQDHGDLGAAGKFFGVEGAVGYFFTVDDDIVYPSDYVEKMISAIKRYDKKAIVCVHGTRFFSTHPSTWMRSRKGFHFLHGLECDEQVNVAGTATVAFHTDSFKLSPRVFSRKNMADMFFAIEAKAQGVPIFAIARSENWLGKFPDVSADTIWHQAYENDMDQSDILARHAPWPVFGRDGMTKKLGMVLRNDTGGLGNISEAFYKHLSPNKYIVIEYDGALSCGRFDSTPERASAVVHGTLADLHQKITDDMMIRFLRGLDALLCFETPYNWRMFDLARELGVRTYLMIMYEWTRNPIPSKPDVILVPQSWYRSEIEAMGCETHFIPLPVDRDVYKFQKRSTAKTFLCNLGRYKKSTMDRDGASLVLRALPLVKNPDVKFVLRTSQSWPYRVVSNMDSRIKVDCNPKKNAADNYRRGDVLLIPRQHEAMSMPCQEAISCGIPILTTGLNPHAAGFPQSWLIPHTDERPLKLNRMIKQVTVTPEDIAAKIDQWAGRDISADSERADFLAEEISWPNQIDQYREVLGMPLDNPPRARFKRKPIKTIAYFGNFRSTWSTETYMANAFEAVGVEVVRLQMFPKTIADVPPCDLFLTSYRSPVKDINRACRDLFDGLGRLGVVTAGYHQDLFFGVDGRDGLVSPAFSFWASDFVFTADGGNQRRFNDRGVFHYPISPAAPAEECVQGTPRPEFEADIIFVGQCDYMHRQWTFRRRLLDFLSKTYGDRFQTWGPKAGNPKMIRNKDLNDLYASAKIVIGDALYSPRYWSNRLFEVPGRGGFLLFPNVEGIEDCFTIGKNMITFESERGGLADFSEIGRQIDFWLANDDARDAVRVAAHEHVKANHTYAHRVREMLSIIEGRIR